MPPAFAERLVALLIRDDRWRDVTLGDLAEEFNRHASRSPAWRARAWYWCQTLALIPRTVAGLLHSFLLPTGDHLMSSILKEVQLAIRSVRRQPLVTGIILVTLALSLGSNAVAFGLIDRMLIRPFSIPSVERLVLVSEHPSAFPNMRRGGVAVSRFLQWREQAETLTDVVAFSSWSANFAGGDRPERIDGQRVSGGFFDLVGVKMALGRPIQTIDEPTGQHRRVVLGDALWRQRFAADTAALGQTIRLNGEAYDVIGIAPQGFDFPAGSQFWVALEVRPEDVAHRSERSISVLARLSDGRRLEEASAEMSAVFAAQQAAHPEIDRRRRVTVWDFSKGMVDTGTPDMLGLIQTTALIVLLIGCTNVAGLLLTRGIERQRDLAVRLALGASRGQIVRQLLVENVMLAAMSVPLALGAAWGVFQLLQRAMHPEVIKYIPGWTDLGIDARLALVVFAASLGTSVLFGVLPAIVSSRVAPTVSLRDGGRSVTPGRQRLRRGLVVAEIALTLPLLVACGMATVAGQRLAFGPQGFNAEGLYQSRTILTARAYPDAVAHRQFADRWLESARQLPGVTSAAVATVLPSTSVNFDRNISIDGLPDDRDNPRTVNFRTVSPGYFDTMEIPIVAGRSFTANDREEGERVSIVSESLASRYFPDGSPLGRRIRLGTNDANWTTVIGVSRDIIDDWFNRQSQPTILVPFAQFPGPEVNLVARTAGDVTELADGLRRALASIDPEQPAFGTRPVRDQIYERTTGIRFVASLMGGLGVLALVLAGCGIYGLMANSVAQRRHEFGVRMALGASSTDVLAMTVRQGAMLSAIGIVLGLIGAVWIARLIETELGGILPSNLWIFLGTIGVLVGVAFLAMVVPARKATRLDPAVVLKE